MALLDGIIFVAFCLILVWRVSQEESSNLAVAEIALAFSVVSTYLSVFRPYLNKPRFVVAPNVTKSPDNEIPTNLSWFFRLRISISSDLAVKNCAGRALACLHEDKRNSGLDPLNALWARQDDKNVDFEGLTIAGKDDFQQLDIAQYLNSNKILRMRLSSEKQLLARSGGLDFYPTEDYFVKVGLYGENAHSKIFWVRLSCVKERADLKAQPYDIEIVKNWFETWNLERSLKQR